MALIKCSECGHEVSDQANQCPNCGAPIKSPSTLLNNSYLTLISLVVGVALVIIGIASFMTGGSIGWQTLGSISIIAGPVAIIYGVFAYMKNRGIK